jgi:hypothetical protein
LEPLLDMVNSKVLDFWCIYIFYFLLITTYENIDVE